MERPRERIGLPGDADQVDMVGHEAVGPDLQAALGGEFGQPMEVMVVIVRLHEDCLPVISPLRDVVGITDRYSSRYSRHIID